MRESRQLPFFKCGPSRCCRTRGGSFFVSCHELSCPVRSSSCSVQSCPGGFMSCPVRLTAPCAVFLSFSAFFSLSFILSLSPVQSCSSFLSFFQSCSVLFRISSSVSWVPLESFLVLFRFPSCVCVFLSISYSFTACLICVND